MKNKIIRTATVALSLDVLLKGQLSFLNNYFNIIAVSGEDNHLKEVREREKVKTIDVALQRQIAPLKDIISLYKLYKILKKEKPIIVHSITPKAGLLTMIAGYFARVPIRIHTFTGLIFPTKTGFSRKLLITMDKILCLFATNIYPEGNGVKNDLLKYKITKKPLNIIANGNVNGIDLDYFKTSLFSLNQNNELKKELEIQQTDFVFIFIGRLVKDKGINELIEAFLMLQENNKKVKLLLVGPLEQNLNPIKETTLSKIINNKSILNVGYKNDVRPYLAIANCLVFPSYREGFPNVVLQAGAMGLPSIVSNINGCNEIIKHNYNGLILPVKDKNAIFAAMNLIIDNTILYETLKSNARQNIESNYDQKLVWNEILNEYNTLLKNV